MGKTKDIHSKIMKTIANIERLEANSSRRLLDFKADLNSALQIKNKNDKYYALSRLRNEIHGYYLDIYQSFTAANKIKKQKIKRKNLNELTSYCEEDSLISSMMTKMKPSRNKTAHPDPYYVNETLFEENKNIFASLKEIKTQIIELYGVEELEVRRQRKSQEVNLEKCFSKNKKNNDKPSWLISHR